MKEIFGKLGPKGLALVGILYTVLPLDLVPDLIPLIGQVDDLGVILILAIAYFASRRREAGSSRGFSPEAGEPRIPQAAPVIVSKRNT